MARTVNEAAYEARRNAILDAAQRAITTRGYEQMAIADLLSELRMSSGAFYHYFDSKPALLLALVERTRDQMAELVHPIVDDPTLSGLDKLQRFFATFDREKLAHKEFVLSFIRVWYADENALFRHKLYIARIELFAPWLEKIIRQGVAEGIFTTPYPDQVGRMIFSLFEDLGYATAELFLSGGPYPSDLPRGERIIEGCIDALERLLGAPTDSLRRPSREELEIGRAHV